MMMEMLYASCSMKLQYDVVKSALKAYDHGVSADENEIRPLYRQRKWKSKERAIGKQRK